MGEELRLPTCFCRRCQHRWIPRIRDPVQCPRCKSARWREPPKRPKKRQARRRDAVLGERCGLCVYTTVARDEARGGVGFPGKPRPRAVIQSVPRSDRSQPYVH
jgi:hypothetical protein